MDRVCRVHGRDEMFIQSLVALPGMKTQHERPMHR
jgi:hypothetical protein